MTDLTEIAQLIAETDGWLVRPDAWGVACLWRRSLNGDPIVVRSLDTRQLPDRIIAWALAELPAVLAELQACREATP